MNLVSTIRAMIPNAGPQRSEVAAIVAGVQKHPALIEAERAFFEIVAARLPLAKRRAEIFERLHVQSPNRTVFKAEEDALRQEQSDIDLRVADLNARAAKLRREIDRLMPDHGRAVAAALASVRRRAAENLLDSIVALDAAISEIGETSKALSLVGVNVTSASPLAFTKAYKTLAEKILREEARNG
ncbi:hypothetical protein [Bradyrhizobium sp. JYMT SZCCT0428]|uniref:hypothetical protein n=1 Tax=Bradyrhizobium sp. JYMT SZCCT0428 TaxID=2807673 RepID=UPI001BABC8AE|nr:hypothetical protein [Bradyrhizobium sp. JYMT SZCCT0428]MBR1154819.1 hypothetical protein [Bradyrhizobium sp. JYMT SZCCT0428]